jgi:hypothetical protein
LLPHNNESYQQLMVSERTFWLKIEIFSFLQTSILEAILSLIIYLFVKMNKLGLDLQHGRDKGPIKANKIEVRIYLSNNSFQGDLGLVGLIERARFGFPPLSLGALSGINRSIDSRNCYKLIQMDFVFPRSNNNHKLR